MQYKVIHFLGALVPGGAELALLRILSDWFDKDFTFSILYTREFDQLKSSFNNIGVSATHLGWKNERDFHQIPKLVKLFRKERPHIVHTHLWTGNYWVTIAARLAGVPVIIETIHHSSRPSRFGFLMHSILRPVIPFIVDATICVSEGVKEYLLRNFKQSSRKISVIYNCIRPNTITSKENVKSIKSKLNLSENIPVLIAIANLRPVIKGYEIYFKALSKVSNINQQEFHVLIVGDITQDHPDFLETLQEQVKSLKLDERVTFLGHRSDITELLAASDILVMPSLYEGGPITILEAMRAGKPAIATRTGAVPEYVIDGETGLIVEPGDSNALANAIEYMLNHPEKWRSMGERGRERFKNNFTIDKTVDQLTNLYKSLLRKKGLIENS